MSDVRRTEPAQRTARTAPLWALIVTGVAALLVGLLAGALILMGMQSTTTAKLADAQRANAALAARVDALTASLTVVPPPGFSLVSIDPTEVSLVVTLPPPTASPSPLITAPPTAIPTP